MPFNVRGISLALTVAAIFGVYRSGRQRNSVPTRLPKTAKPS
jgi:hypothetical protein